MKGDLITVNNSLKSVRPVESLGITEFVGEWVSRLKQIELDLDVILQRAEGEFLSIGRMFWGFLRRARIRSETSADGAGKITGSEIV